MTTTKGAGVTECQADWTIESVLDDYIADNKLSRRKRAYLQAVFDRTIDSIEEAVSLDIAGSIYCSELELPQGSYWCQCVAAALDFMTPSSELLSDGRQLWALNWRLVLNNFLEIEDAEAIGYTVDSASLGWVNKLTRLRAKHAEAMGR